MDNSPRRTATEFAGVASVVLGSVLLAVGAPVAATSIAVAGCFIAGLITGNALIGLTQRRIRNHEDDAEARDGRHPL